MGYQSTLLIMTGLALHTPMNCAICPDLSKIFPPAVSSESPSLPVSSSSTTELINSISGDVDFYSNGSIRWGIELRVFGKDTTEHSDRFGEGGRYHALGVTDYVIIDFHQNKMELPAKVRQHERRVSVFFDEDNNFESCYCLWGLDSEPLRLTLGH